MGDDKHKAIDLRNLKFGHMIVEKLRTQPNLLDLANGNLERWIQQNPENPHPAYLEWKYILEEQNIREIIALLTQDSENARRLRQSNPFAGSLTPQERWGVIQSHDKRST